MTTTIIKQQDVSRKWFVVDAAGKPAGRLAVEIAYVLRGKNNPAYTPSTDMGDFVVVINAAQVKLTGSKEEQKIYQHFTGFPSGLKKFTAATVRSKDPTRIVTQAVRGMLPRNKLRANQMTRLKVYPGAEHPHAAQKPEALAL